jgi:hypothetical protein
MAGPTIRAVKRLFALSANTCAFPDCGRAIVQPDGLVTGEICHIASPNKKGPRYDPNLTIGAIHSFENLILFCERHHKIVDWNTPTYTKEVLRNLKALHEKNGNIEITLQDARKADRLLKSYLSIHAEPHAKVMVNSPGGIQAEKLTIITRKKNISVAPHPDSIAADLSKRNYIKYLIARYNRFQHADKGKEGKGKYIVIYNAIKGEFGMKWDEVPLAYFENLSAYLHRRILKSTLGRNLNARGQKCFSFYEEWLQKPEQM